MLLFQLVSFLSSSSDNDYRFHSVSLWIMFCLIVQGKRHSFYSFNIDLTHPKTKIKEFSIIKKK